MNIRNNEEDTQKLEKKKIIAILYIWTIMIISSKGSCKVFLYLKPYCYSSQLIILLQVYHDLLYTQQFVHLVCVA